MRSPETDVTSHDSKRKDDSSLKTCFLMSFLLTWFPCICPFSIRGKGLTCKDGKSEANMYANKKIEVQIFLTPNKIPALGVVLLKSMGLNRFDLQLFTFLIE